MYVLVALVVLSIAPDQPIKLRGAQFATEQECSRVAEQAPAILENAYKRLGLEAEVRVGCQPTGKQDI